MMRRLFSRLRRRFHVLIQKEATPVPAGGTPKPGETTARPGETTARPGETTARPGETTARPGETTARPGETAAKPAEPTPEPPQPAAKPAETTAEPAAPALFPPDPITAPPESVLAPFLSVSAACGAVRRAIKALRPPVAKLPDAERQRLGGQIFYGAVHFVFQMSDVLRERPQLSPDPARIHAAGLRGRQWRAICWSIVHGVLADLAEQANDCYLHEQGHALEEAQQVLTAFDLQMEQASLKGRPDPQLIEDALRIARARVVLQRGEQRQRQARRRADKKLREARARAGIRDTAAGRKGAGKRRRGEPAGSPLSLEGWGQHRLRSR
jgi:hypothetical protein